MQFIIFTFFSLLIFSCNYGSQNFISIKKLIEDCREFTGKSIVLKAKYLGWNCPQTCKHPGLTRSDTCIEDGSGCIYLYGFGGLNPLKDKGSIHTFYGVVKKSRSGVCYIEVKKVK